jgi:membrane protein DedA with SNARE-associated domain
MTVPLATPDFLHSFAGVLSHYGYLAVFAIIAVESFGVPAPGQTVLIAAAVFAGNGKLSLPLVVVVAFLAATGGDNIGFAIGRFGGRRLVSRFGRYVGLTEERMQGLERRFTRHGGKLVVLARFVDGLRQFNGILSGLAGMGWARFLGFNALGALLWVLTWAAVGRYAGHHLEAIFSQVRRFQLVALVAVVLVIAVLVVRHLLHNRAARSGETESG